MNSICECSKSWGKRLALDTRLNYVSAVWSPRGINDEIILSLEKITSYSSSVCSNILQLKSNLYFHHSAHYTRTRDYLRGLAQIKSPPGIYYTESLENKKNLLHYENTINEQSAKLELNENKTKLLENQVKTMKDEIIQLENDNAAIEQNSGGCEPPEKGPLLFEDADSLSEDVKSGAQRLAIRLTDSAGEGIPTSSLTIENDIAQRLKELALTKIQQLSEQLNNKWTP